MQNYFITSLADLLGCVGVVVFFTFACWVSLDHSYILEHIDLYCLCSGTSTSGKIRGIGHLTIENHLLTFVLIVKDSLCANLFLTLFHV